MMRFIVNQSGDMAINFDNICVMSCAPQTNGYCIAVDLDYSSNDDLLVIGEYKSELEAKAVFRDILGTMSDYYVMPSGHKKREQTDI